MTTWQHSQGCREHGTPDCGCEPFMMVSYWKLRNDAGNDLAVIQQFETKGPYYGNTAYGRTGASTLLEGCQARCEKMLEQGHR